MQNRIKGTVGAIVLSVASAVTVAAPVTYTFTGVVNAGFQNVGRTVTGWLTIDFATFNESCTIPTPDFACPMARYGPGSGAPYTHPLQVRGYATDGLFTTQVGGGTYRDTAWVLIERNFQGSANQFTVVGESAATPTGTGAVIALETNDYLGAQSAMFSNPNAGLDLYQPVDFLASTRLFSIIDLSDGLGGHETATLTSLAATRSQVPEPGTWALAGFALAAVASFRRRFKVLPSSPADHVGQ